MRADPVQVVTRIPASDPRVAAYAAALAHQRGMAAVSIQHGLHGAVSVVDVTPAGSAQSATAQHLVAALRANRPAFRTYITGSAALLTDIKNQIINRLPYALALIALATFVLLFLMTGSVLVPIKALIMNTLSLGAPTARLPAGRGSSSPVIASARCAIHGQVMALGVHSSRLKRRSDDVQTILKAASASWKLGSDLEKLVELRGLEPLASCMPCNKSNAPAWASIVSTWTYCASACP